MLSLIVKLYNMLVLILAFTKKYLFQKLLKIYIFNSITINLIFQKINVTYFYNH